MIAGTRSAAPKTQKSDAANQEHDQAVDYRIREQADSASSHAEAGEEQTLASSQLNWRTRLSAVTPRA
jgi:hypothetical protein